MIERTRNLSELHNIKSFSPDEVKKRLERIKAGFIGIPVIWDKKGYPYSAFTLTDYEPAMEPSLIKTMAELLVYAGNFEKANMILSEADRGGGPLTQAVAELVDLPYILSNWYPTEVEGMTTVKASPGFSGNGYICVPGLNKDFNIVLVDDLVSSGGTVLALLEAIRSVGATVIDATFVGEKTNLGGREKIRSQFGIEIKTLVKFRSGEKYTEEVL